MSTERCDRCMYWKCNGDEANLKEHADDREGTCRLNPPQHLPAVVHLLTTIEDELQEEEGNSMSQLDYIMLVHKEAAQTYSWAQPTTTGAGWCGQWQRAPEEV